MGKPLQGTQTHTNLKEAFAGESQANRRYLYFAKMADIEGQPDIAGLFRDTAEGETGHAHGHLEYLKQVGDPATGEPIGDTSKNLKASIAGETYEYTKMYPGFAKTAREEGFEEIAEWFETLARREVARRTFPEGPRLARQVIPKGPPARPLFCHILSYEKADPRRHPGPRTVGGGARRAATPGDRAQEAAARLGRPAGLVRVRK